MDIIDKAIDDTVSTIIKAKNIKLDIGNEEKKLVKTRLTYIEMMGQAFDYYKP